MTQPAALPPELAPLAEDDPRAVGPFRVVGRLGAGGMGAVYGALDAQGRCVAVKVIHERYAGQADYRQRFAREVELLRDTDVECAPAFLGADPEAALPWLATEFVPGRTLSQHVRRFGPLAGGALLAFAAGTAEAIGAIHAAGILHRDIKPGNVMLSPAGPRVLDFGIARGVEESGPERGIYGTPGYLAPERLAGQPSSMASDVFAWGALVVFAATGRGPFGGGGTDEVLRRTEQGDHDLTGIPDSLVDLVRQALAVSAAERPTAAECFAGALALAEPGAVPGASDEERRYRLRRALVAAWRGFDAAGHDPRVWAAIGAAGVSGAGLLGGGIAAGASSGGAAALGQTAMGATAATTAVSLTTKIAIGAGAAAVATAVVVGGVVVAGDGGEPATPTDTEAEASPEESDDSPPFAAQEVEYRGLTLLVPEDWGVYHREDEIFHPGEVGGPVEEWVMLVPEDAEGCGEPPTEFDRLWAPPGYVDGICEHIKLLGPAAIAVATPGGGAYDPDNGYAPSSEIIPCPENVEFTLWDAGAEGVPAPPEDFGVRDSATVAVGDREAEYREAAMGCVSRENFQDMGHYHQRAWYLAEEEILIVDDWLDGDFPELLQYAEW